VITPLPFWQISCRGKDAVMTRDNALLERVRKLLAKAEAQGVTPAEAEALTAKAAELIARHGIDRALLAADRPETDQPASKIMDLPNPWGRIKAHLLCGLAAAMRCQAVLTGSSRGVRVHVFGYRSDLERLDLLYTSLLLQQASALQQARIPEWTSSPRAWRRSWLLGFAAAVIARVRVAEHAAATQATSPQTTDGSRTALVLAGRTQVIRREAERAYPFTRSARITYTGSGYPDGYTEGGKANIGGTHLTQTPANPAQPLA
jgi:hypothetical protein